MKISNLTVLLLVSAAAAGGYLVSQKENRQLRHHLANLCGEENNTRIELEIISDNIKNAGKKAGIDYLDFAANNLKQKAQALTEARRENCDA